ncbi:MAG: polyphosphate:AMP phosphotransferase [Halofilum sp. (in: g-proteobacteria)]|nr:polyphosphate:AMP phosphotransferase [Halofilum sp. (in: g-proteobacteria)]
MFEVAKIGRKVSREAFRDEVPDLRVRLLEAQKEIEEQGIAVIVVIAGMEGAGKGEVVNRLNTWLDSRGIRVHAFWDLTEEDLERPRYWRYWRAMPPRGRIAVLFGGWYLEPIERRYFDQYDDAELEHELRRVRELERMLVEDGILLVKFWYHFSRQAQRKRLKKLSRDDRSRWKMLPGTASDLSGHYHRFEHVADQLIRHTDTGRAPWHVVEAADPLYRDLTTGRTLLGAMEQRLADAATPVPAEPAQAATGAGDADLPADPDARVTLLERLDLGQALDKPGYRRRLAALQRDLNELAWSAYEQRRAVVAVFEGVDAAGKGGAIRRVTQALDARLYRAVSTGAPSDEERAYHYLWRFWRQIPRAGYMTIFDRSWYGRVLVERVEGLTPAARWRRAFMEINDFEDQLCEHGVILVKFWLQISREEQLERFRARENTPYKAYKITAEDWHNRDRWDAYRIAVNEMLERTSTERAPWTLVAAEDKRHARVQVLTTLIDAMAAQLEYRGQ